MKNLISIIIVNWDGKKHLEICIPSLLNIITSYDLEIIVVDNGSIDGSIEYLESYESIIRKKNINLKIIKNKKNLGFAPANNQGYRVAKGNLILFINNDTKVPRNFLDPLVEVLLSDPKIGAVQPKILYLDEPLKIDSTGSFFTKTGILYHRGHQKIDRGQFDKQDEIFSMKGACMLFKRSVLEKVGLFDESFFAYFEETDLCHRVWLAGFKVLYSPRSVIYHKVGGSTSKVGSPFIQFHSFKNRISTYLTNFETGTLLWLMPIHILLSFTAGILFLVMGKFEHFLAVFKAFFWIIFNFRMIIKKRNNVQKNIRKISDKEYLQKVSNNVPIIYYWYLIVGGLEKFDAKN